MNHPDFPEWRAMLAGQIYDATHPALLALLSRAKRLLRHYNDLDPDDNVAREAALRDILGHVGSDPFIVQPFFCDYGINIRVGDRFFANTHFTVLDEAVVSIGDDVFIGPNVSIYTACHSTDVAERNSRREWACPVTIGDNVWIGGSVTILPGVTVGDGVTIGAGSVVTRDIPAHTVAAGNPARVIRRLA